MWFLFSPLWTKMHHCDCFFFVWVSKYYASLMVIEQERNWVEQYIGDNEWETEIGSRRPIIIRRVALNCWLPFCSFIDRGRILIGVRKFIHNSVIKCTHARKLQWKLAPAEESRLQQRWICIKCRSTALHSSGLVHRKYMYIYMRCVNTIQGVCMCARGRSRWECKHVQSCWANVGWQRSQIAWWEFDN